LTMILFREEKIHQGRPGIADMDAAGRRRRETNDWTRHYFPCHAK
jgi:hypothetical protein